MIDIAWKNIMRVRTRSLLTILGILIGIAAIVALGSISDSLNAMIQRNLELSSGKLIITEAGLGGFFGPPTGKLGEAELEAVKGITGVKDAIPIMVYMEWTGTSIPEWWAIGIEPDKLEYFKGERIQLWDGRTIESGDYVATLVGKDVADLYGLDTGDSFEIKEQSFEVVGILEKSHIMDIDRAVIVPLADLQDILKTDSFQMIYAVSEDVGRTEVVAEDIEDAVEAVDVITAKEAARQAEQIIGQIKFFTVGIAGIAAVVGGLGVMNTMIMTVLERRREIGVLKAMGATNRRVLAQFMTEALLLSTVGGLAGVFFGFLASVGLALYSGWMVAPVVTAEIVAFGLGFALLLGLVGGLWPAWRAARLDPVEALRYE